MVSLLRRRSVRGMPKPQAQTLVEELDEALSTAITQEIFTKADIAELQGTVQGLNERLQGEQAPSLNDHRHLDNHRRHRRPIAFHVTRTTGDSEATPAERPILCTGYEVRITGLQDP